MLICKIILKYTISIAKAEPTKTEAAKKPETPKVETEIPAADEDDSDSDDESDEEGDEDDSDSGEDGSDSESEEEAPLVQFAFREFQWLQFTLHCIMLCSISIVDCNFLF